MVSFNPGTGRRGILEYPGGTPRRPYYEKDTKGRILCTKASDAVRGIVDRDDIATNICKTCTWGLIHRLSGKDCYSVYYEAL